MRKIITLPEICSGEKKRKGTEFDVLVVHKAWVVKIKGVT